jgi:hypothetical protein
MWDDEIPWTYQLFCLLFNGFRGCWYAWVRSGTAVFVPPRCWYWYARSLLRRGTGARTSYHPLHGARACAGMRARSNEWKMDHTSHQTNQGRPPNRQFHLLCMHYVHSHMYHPGSCVYAYQITDQIMSGRRNGISHNFTDSSGNSQKLAELWPRNRSNARNAAISTHFPISVV